MFVKLLDTKHLGGTCFDLFFEIENIEEDNHVDGQIFDIHGLVQIRLCIQNTIDRMSKILSSVRKHLLTKMLKVEMKVICEDPKFVYDFACSEKWSPYSSLFKLPYTKNIKFTLEVDIKVTSTKSVLEIMYLDEDFTDFQLSTAEGNVAVHRACLASHSDVFRRMLCGEWKEAVEGRVQLEGVTLRTLQHLKQYIYLGTLPTDGLQTLLLIAIYYLMDELQVECIVKLAHSVTSENLYDLLEFACVNNIPELTFALLKTLRAQPRDVIESAHQRMIKPKQDTENVTENKEATGEEPTDKTE